MKLRHLGLIAIAATMLPLSGCENPGTNPKIAAQPAAAAKKKEADGLMRIKLKDIESQRLGIELAEVAQAGDRLTVPYTALIYDPAGKEWAYTSTDVNSYVRSPLKVSKIEGQTVFLKEGPPKGTKVVTAGAVELFGIEFGIGK